MAEHRLPSIRVNAALNSIRSILSIIFPLVTYPYVTRVLQAENLGKVNFASSILSYFSLIAVLGLTVYAGREGAGIRNDKKKVNIFCSELLTLNLCTTIFSYLILLIVLAVSPSLSPYMGLIGIYSVTILFSTLGMEWIYTIYEDYLYITIRSIIMQMLSLILMFLLVKEKEDYYYYAAINVLANVGGNIFNFLHARKYIRLKLTFNRNIFRHLRYSIVFFASSIASSIYSNIGNTLLGIMSGDISVGLLAVSMKIYVMVKGIIVAIMQVTSSRLAFYKHNHMEDDFNRVVSKLIKTLIVMLCPIVVGINLVAKEIILLIAGDGYFDAISSLRILSIAILGSIFASVAGCILISSKKEKNVLYGTIAAAAINIIINVMFIPVFGHNGAALAVVIAEFAILLINGHQCKGLVKLESVKKVVINCILACLIMLIYCIIIERLQLHIFLGLIVKVIGSSLVYFICLGIGENEIFMEYFSKIRIIFNR